MKKIILYTLLMLCLQQWGAAQTRISGRVMAADERKPLPGAVIRLKGTSVAVSADSAGRFTLGATAAQRILQVSFLGYETLEVEIGESAREILISLQPATNSLEEVIVSTGYQDLAAGRATGSFVSLNEQQLNRRVSADILSRLEDRTPGLIFNKDATLDGRTDLSIRGRSTINANAQPLIVLDNFPFEGDINSINPNDVESITVLKDAAAAAIWGARAGNGVIVITTKKGRYNQAPVISFNTNLTAVPAPDLFYQGRMLSADYIDIEKRLFGEGYYRSAELSANKTPLSPVVEVLIAQRDGLIRAAEADAKINALKAYDVRNDYRDQFYTTGLNQQYAASLRGGSGTHRYSASAGYDKNLSNTRGSAYDRITLNAANTYALFNQKLEISTGIFYTEGTYTRNNPAITGMGMSGGQLYPYARLVDGQGRPLATVKDYRSAFIGMATENGLLDWDYRPVEELNNAENTSAITDYRLRGSAKYRLMSGLDATVLYQYGRGITRDRKLYNENSYYTRNLVNRFTMVNPDGSLSRPVPLGAIADRGNQISQTHNLRGQLNYNLQAREHGLNVLAGFETQEQATEAVNYRLYGYDEAHETSMVVDYTGRYSSYVNPASANNMIPNADTQRGLNDRFRSLYSNASYNYGNRYMITLSSRFDQSNLFGVEANQKGVPLWSAGVAWDISNEYFYKSKLFTSLKVRLSYGYSGNINKSLSAFTTARYNNGISTANGQPYAEIENPPNPALRWERVRIFNAGLDFEIGKGLLSGSADIFKKDGRDLIGTIPFAPSAGITSFTGNTASTSGHGIDLALNSRWLRRSSLQAHSALIFSYVRDKVKTHAVKGSGINYLQALNLPLEGKPLYSIYSYPWGGLDPQTGDPIGYLDGAQSTDYLAMRTALTPENMIYNGPARPQVFGSWLNSLQWKNISVSANISYRLNYYFRKSSVAYGNTYGLGGHEDYYRRWKKPGDEKTTGVPSVPAVANFLRDEFYQYSQQLVLKGDHIRLKDIQVAYSLAKSKMPRLPFSHAQVYLYMDNAGMIWKANKEGLDPDYPLRRPPLTLSAGLKLEL